MPSIVMATTCVKLSSGIPKALVKNAIVTHNIADQVTSSKKDILVPASIYHPMLPSHSPLFITVLLDTGAMTDDYVNLPTALWLANAGVKRSLCGDQVCSGLGNVNQLCVKCEGKYTFELVIYNDLTRGDQKLTVTAKAVPSAHYSLILGLKTIKKFNLSLTCFTYFTNLTTGRSLINLVDYYQYLQPTRYISATRGHSGKPNADRLASPLRIKPMALLSATVLEPTPLPRV